MKKLIISVSLIVVFAFYALFASSKSSPSSSASPAQTLADQTPPVPSSSPVAIARQPAQTPPATVPSGTFKNGSYTGSVADAYFGNVQVRATVSGGRLASVSFLQYPNDRGTSREISARAMPALISEAIRSQSARVDIVSGATQTSQGFIQSLGSALAQAAN